MFKNMLLKFQRRFNIPNCNVLLAKDCSRSNIWRKDIFPDYKKNRDDRSVTKFNTCIFRYTYSNIIEKLHQAFGFKVVELDRAEADDVIALLSNAIHSTSPQTHVYIVSNDNDYIQLVDDWTHVIDMKCEPLHNRVCHTPQDYLMTKIIMGDKSDNIPPIAKRIGKKRASALVNNREELDKLLLDEQVRQQYELNKKLIDFTNIPTGFKTDIHNKLRELVQRPYVSACRFHSNNHYHQQYTYSHHNYRGVSKERW